MNIKSIATWGLVSALSLSVVSCDNEPFALGSELIPSETTDPNIPRAALKAPKANYISIATFATTFAAPDIVGTEGITSTPIEILLNKTQANATSTVTLAIIPASEVIEAFTATGGDASVFLGAAPDGLFKLENSAVEVPAGSKTAKTNLVYDDKTKITGMKADGNYLVGVKVLSLSNGEVASSGTTLFATVNYFERKVKPYAEASFAGMTKLAYSEIESAGPDAGWGPYAEPANAFDGSINNGMQWIASRTEYGNYLDVILKSPTTIKGLRLAPITGTYSRQSLRRARIVFYDANDEEILDLGVHAVHTTANLVDGYLNLQLYAPVTAKRVIIYDESNRSLIGLSELELYK